MTYANIEFSIAGDVATLRLNRPAVLNAMNRALLEEVIDALDRLRDESLARALLLTGTGRAFSAGYDIGDGAADGDPEAPGFDAGGVVETHFNPVVERLADLPIPIVAAVNGVAAGAACSIALMADIVVAARSSYFLQAFVNIGLVPDAGATWLLPRLVGRSKAAAMMMLGERIPAELAERWGMIYQVVDDEALDATAATLAGRLAQGPITAYRLIRQGLFETADAPLQQALRIERRHQRLAGRTADYREGTTAFRQKRQARFSGR